MKKTLLYLMVLVLTGFSVKGQVTVETTPLWFSHTTGVAGSTTPPVGINHSWFNTVNLNGSAVYNGKTNHLYVNQRGVSATSGGKIFVLNSETGAYLRELGLTGYTGAQYDFHKVRVTSDGEIYAVTMKLLNSVSQMFVYYWENEASSTPVKITLTNAGLTARLGDSFEVFGSGEDTYLVIGGSGTNDLFLFKRKNEVVGFSFEFVKTIAMGGNFAITSISAVPNIANLANSSYFVGGNSQVKKFVDVSTGTPTVTSLYSNVDDFFASNLAILKHFTVNGISYLATTGGSVVNGYNVKIYKVLGSNYILSSNYKLVRHFQSNKSDAIIANGAVSDLALTNSSLNIESADANGNAKIGFFQLVQQNVLSAWVAEFDVSLAGLINLNVVNVNQKGKITWKTTKENDMKEFQILRSSDGVNFSLLTTVSSKATGGNSTTAEDYEYIDQSPLNGDNYYKIKMVNKANVEDLSAIISFNATLPVSLTSFDASLKNGQSTLIWSTQSESNNSGFEIQRSTDGEEFTTIAFEKSKAANGNSSEVLNYTYVDKTALNGTNYYRLKQLDLNGDSKLYEIKSVNVGVSTAGIQVYPNPVTSYVKVKVEDYKGLEYKLYDSSGKIVVREKASQQETEISTVNLAPSIYILKVTKGSKEISSTKIIKQ